MTDEPATRRKQADRTRETRRRLTEATLRCIARDGYAGTSISRVLAEAGLSRGAHIHQFATKEQLILASADRLFAEIYRNVGLAILAVDEADQRIATMVHKIWSDVLMKDAGRVLLELVTAAQSDPAIARNVRDSFARSFAAFRIAAEHYFMSRTDTPAADIVETAIWDLFGLRLQSVIQPVSTDDPRLLARVETLQAQLVQRPGVTEPPELPSDLR